MDTNGERVPSDDSDADEPSFDDPSDFVDDISDEALLSDCTIERPSLDDRMSTVIVVDNVPSVKADRLEKLRKVINKIMARFGEIVTEHYPAEANGETKGYIFLEYKSAQEAANAVKTAHGYRLDKAHVFSVHAFSDFEKYSNVDEKWTVPEKQKYDPQENLHSWLLNPDCVDQFAVSYAAGDRTVICSNTLPETTQVIERDHWTEGYLRWSPNGTYLATMHKQGVALWGGKGFRRIERFAHLGVKFVDFSPCERFLVTFCPQSDKEESAIIWDIRTGMKKRGFQCEDSSKWPIFKWNHDGKYFAKQGNGLISIYETQTFGLLDKKSIQAKDVQDFLWSPVDDVIAFWVPENVQNPARFTLMEIPSRNEIRFKTLFNVSTCEMYWQQKGEYLCLKVDRFASKNKKTTTANLEIFSLKEKQIPVNQVEMKGSLVSFAWEPVGPKFVTVEGTAPMQTIRFFKVEQGGTITPSKMLEKKSCNMVSWSPQGRFIVLGYLPQGLLEFCDTFDMCIMNATEHFQATDVEWDPTGRYVASQVSWWQQKSADHGYILWSFQGKLLARGTRDNFCQMMWRPRPPSLLTSEDIQELQKDMKKYQREFEVKDRMSQTKSSKELVEKRRAMLKEFAEYRRRKGEESKKKQAELVERREAMRRPDARDEAIEEETVEFLVSEKSVVVDKND